MQALDRETGRGEKLLLCPEEVTLDGGGGDPGWRQWGRRMWGGTDGVDKARAMEGGKGKMPFSVYS